MCGKPCSGKTTYANQIAEYIRGKNKEVTIINLESLKLDRSSAYGSNSSELT